jgi:hypothetical protein
MGSEIMPQLKIICLSNPAIWSEITKHASPVTKMLSLSQQSKSWLNLNSNSGNRQGFYKIEKLGEEQYVTAMFVSESPVNEEYQSLEKLLKDDGCLPNGTEIPTPVPHATKALLFFDFSEGICYMYSPGKEPSLDSVIQGLSDLQNDIEVHLEDVRVFEWEEKLVTRVTEFARSEGFTPYKVKANLETVSVTAEGDLDNNELWKRIEGAVELDRWQTIAYVKSTKSEMFIFGLTRLRSKNITMPQIEEEISAGKLLERILEMRNIIEKSLGCDIRQYCFPERLLSSFK